MLLVYQEEQSQGAGVRGRDDAPMCLNTVKLRDRKWDWLLDPLALQRRLCEFSLG